jgi:uncharacterized repeat protein (TIGR03803 family)
MQAVVAAPHPQTIGERGYLMRTNFMFSLLALFVLTFGQTALCAPKFRVLHAFTGGNDGGTLWGSLLVGNRGNVFGTTYYGGLYGGGTVFELTPGTGGAWTLADLHDFCSQSGCADGSSSTAGMIFDTAGNLYGTTKLGGAYERGTVLELTPEGETWDENVLYSFTQDGVAAPYAGVVMDPSGNLFGTGGGWAYELSSGFGGWTLTGLHIFTGEKGDGSGPLAGVILDPTGNLYGTTEHGGSSNRCGGGCGTVYRLHPMPDGSWKETILHDFQDQGDGSFPGVGALARDKVGNLYGTASSGTIFQLSPGAHGGWKFTVLDTISGEPAAGVVIGKAGELYGTTIAGGKCCGTVYKLSRGSKGKWKLTTLHTFLGFDGAQPDANLVLDGKGNLYGTTATGGAGGYGVAFEVTP